MYTRLKAAGGILLGKTNMPEFALWWETDNEVFREDAQSLEPGQDCGRLQRR